ncbi:hypothetical protein JTB14_031437 [Gonioctena quinquepunctata]|nr:hypothetical protein JTB14_031437 [Gonioctena quinquepunctata]
MIPFHEHIAMGQFVRGNQNPVGLEKFRHDYTWKGYLQMFNCMKGKDHVLSLGWLMNRQDAAMANFTKRDLRLSGIKLAIAKSLIHFLKTDDPKSSVEEEPKKKEQSSVHPTPERNSQKQNAPHLPEFMN